MRQRRIDMQGEQVVRMTFSVTEVARQLSISVRKLRQEMSQGRIGYVRLGRRVLMTVDQIDQYIAGNSVHASDVTSVAAEIAKSAGSAKPAGLSRATAPKRAGLNSKFFG